MNMDKPKKRCTVHSEVCRYSREKSETSLKGIGTIKMSGGWMPFISIEEARTYFDENWYPLRYAYSICHFCLEWQRIGPGFKYSLRARKKVWKKFTC